MRLKLWSLVLIVIILIVAGITTYIATNPETGEVFTEFYILGPDGKAADYPVQLDLGQEAKVITGIVNREYRTVTYTLEVYIDSSLVYRVDDITLGNDEEWQEPVSITPEKTGLEQKIVFMLLQDGEDAGLPLELFILIDVD